MADERHPSSMSPPQLRRARRMVLAVLVGVAVVGFFTGVSSRRAPTGYQQARPEPTRPEGLAEAPTNAELGRGGFGENRARQAAAFAALLAPAPPRLDSVDDPQARAATLSQRAARRAYDGAPPVIPHAIDDGASGAGTGACLACHAHGARVQDRIAPVMSHGDERVSCTQCHASAAGGPPFAADARPSQAAFSTDNGFVGLAAPSGGPRAWPGAPPVIPHGTFMRERCGSCHGGFQAGIASSHTERQSCQQCHVRSAALDQQPLAERRVRP